MKKIILLVLTLFIFGCNEQKQLDGYDILSKTIAKHDSLNAWSKTKLNIHIQEPRISNPHRYSILELDNSTNSFKLSRNRDQFISEHIIDSTGNSYVFLDGKIETDTILIKKYRLDASRNTGYKNFYKLLYGIPMSLKNSYVKIINTSENLFNEEKCYKIEMELKEPMISRYWNLFVSKPSMRVKGIEIVSPDKPDEGERIYFDELIVLKGIKIPRIRHWLDLKNNTYAGTDLIVKELSD